MKIRCRKMRRPSITCDPNSTSSPFGWEKLHLLPSLRVDSADWRLIIMSGHGGFTLLILASLCPLKESPQVSFFFSMHFFFRPVRNPKGVTGRSCNLQELPFLHSSQREDCLEKDRNLGRFCKVGPLGL